jgi:CrcB protein
VRVLTWCAAALAGALGALARYTVDAAVSARLRTDFPAGTLVVNLTGTFVLGLLVGAVSADDARFIAGTGFLGGYTTFSTWMVETERLGEAGAVRLLAANLVVPLAFGFGAAAIGWYVGRGIG